MTTRLCVSSRSKAFLILVFFSFGVCAQQVDRIEWQENASFSTADKDAIVSLTKTMGIESPRRVSHAQYLPNFCEFVRVESVASEAGHLRTWIELEIHRQDWMKCYKTPRGSKTRHMGRWVASSSDLSTKTEWRIEANVQKNHSPFCSPFWVNQGIFWHILTGDARQPCSLEDG